LLRNAAAARLSVAINSCSIRNTSSAVHDQCT
jgi:hypothetical protein